MLDTEFEEPIPYGFTWAYDFNAEDLDFSGGNPPRVSGLGTVNEWISHTINVEQFETPIYGSNIGTKINFLIGSTLDPQTISEVKNEIEEAISIHDRIDEVSHVGAFAIHGNLYTYFSYETDDTIGSQALIQLV